MGTSGNFKVKELKKHHEWLEQLDKERKEKDKEHAKKKEPFKLHPWFWWVLVFTTPLLGLTYASYVVKLAKSIN